MNPFQPNTENPQIKQLTAQIEAEKNSIREACLRMGKAYYDAHKDDERSAMEPDVRLVLETTESIKAKQHTIRELKGLTLCPECNKEISKDAMFCNYCGHRMKELDPVAPAAEAPAVCTVCGKEIRPGQRFCTGCGTPVAAQPVEPVIRRCAGCNTELPEGAKFCFSCGAPVE